jgi:hypothetical protein
VGDAVWARELCVRTGEVTYLLHVVISYGKKIDIMLLLMRSTTKNKFK